LILGKLGLGKGGRVGGEQEVECIGNFNNILSICKTLFRGG